DGCIHRIFAHKDVRNTAATPGPTFLGIKEDKFRIAYLRRPTRKELPANGDFRAGMIIGEATLEYMAEKTSVQRTGYNQNG
ncbi:MAG: SU10 major capsid protein, partial [Minisyncoccia bacterium]